MMLAASAGLSEGWLTTLPVESCSCSWAIDVSWLFRFEIICSLMTEGVNSIDGIDIPLMDTVIGSHLPFRRPG